MKSSFAKVSFSAVDRDRSKLHPLMRDMVHELEMMSEAEGMPFRMYEGFRTPQRQQSLYLQGRVQSRPGKKLTESQPWYSFHQFGLAADFAQVKDGEWILEPTPGDNHLWLRLRELGDLYGLESFDSHPGHFQLFGFELAALRRGSYPSAGDHSWEDNLFKTLASYPISASA